ncbi:MAG: HIT family protein [DPANN group archaeon]|nr:HIT family protein [DPANN group archaeon]
MDKAQLEKKLKKLSEMTPEEQATAVKTLFDKEELDFLRHNAQSQGGMQRCVFCSIAKGEVRAKIVYDDAHFSAFLDINPANPGHILVIPKQHYEVLPQIPDELLGAYMKLLKILAAAVFEATQAQGVNIIQNNGVAAGQAVPHVHIHIIPRFENDGIKLNWDAKKVTEKQLENLQSRIIAAAQGLASGKQAVKQKEIPEAPKPKPKKEKIIKVKKRRP